MAGESKKGAMGERRLISADLEDLRKDDQLKRLVIGLWTSQGTWEGKAWRHSWESHLHKEYYGNEVNKT